MLRLADTYEEAEEQGLLWTPAMLAGGLKCWLDCGDPTAFTFSGSDVTVVRDRPPAIGGTFTRITNAPAYSATGLNNRPCLSFTASPHERIVSDTYVALTLPIVVVAIFYPNSSTGSYTRFFAWASSSGSDNTTTGLSCMIRSTDSGTGFPNNLATYFNSSATPRCSTAMTYNQVNLCSVLIDGSGNIAHFINGLAGGTGTLGASTSWSAVKFLVGCDTVAGATGGGAASFLGDMGEAVVYCGDGAADVRQMIEGYIAWRWRRPDLLGGAHRYRGAAPLIGG